VTTPLLSFIVLSYNYEDYIPITIRSILQQTVQDFEIIVVDDASSDRSCEVVRGFNDPRIHLIVNERNLGGAGSYNVAVEAARGEWLVNLDADDWIAPEKSARQLKAATQNPQLDVIGTWVHLVGSDGRRHPDASRIEPAWNRDYAFNLVDTWIGKNHLCRSSTMMRRAAHLRIGLDDAGMVAAPDYELWTRALAQGCRFHLLDERLTFSRLHSRGVTRADLLRSFLEICFALRKNIVPLIEGRALWPSFAEVLRWVGTHPELPALASRERERLLALLMTGTPIPTYADFRAALSKPDPVLETIGRRTLFALAQAQLNGPKDMPSAPPDKGLKGGVSRLVCDLHPEHSLKTGNYPWGALLKRDLKMRLKRWIAPGKGRWVRTKARLSRVETRLLRFFHS
jgi:glycosyltransferase involved in cell wall biosynthesis